MIVYRTALRSVQRRPGQALLTGIAIVAATAFAAIAVLLAMNARVALVEFGMSTPQSADAVVLLENDLESADAAELAEAMRALPGASQVSVDYLGDVVVEFDGVATTWKLSSDAGTGPLSAISELEAGAAPELGEVVLGASTADRVGANVGDTLMIEGREFLVAGIGSVHEFGMDVALIREADAVALGDLMFPAQILIHGAVSLDEVRALAGGSTVIGGEERRAEEARSVTDTLVGVFGALTVFIGLAVLAAIVIVSSTFRILLARRASELALLRCVGATKSQVSRSVLLEAACIGLLGGVIGAALGLGGAAALVAVGRSAGLLTNPFISAPAALVACVALAVVCAIVAAYPAARAAGKTAPVVALGEASSTEARPSRLGARLLVAASLTLTAIVAGAAGLSVASTDEFFGLALAALSGTLVFIALVVVGPFLIKGAALAVRPLVSPWLSMRLAVSNAKRASRRTAAMATVLTLGVGMTAALIVGVAGATEDSRATVAQNFPSEAIIPISLVNDPDAVVDALAAHPDIEASIAGEDILVDPAPGSSPEALRTAVIESLDVGTPVYWAADVQSGIEQTIMIGQIVGGAMIGVTVLVALIGVMVTLALSVAERRQEIALLRALGVSKAGARRSIAAEAALASLVGATTGLIFGSAYGLIALHILGMSFGQPPVLALVLLFLGVVAASVVAAAIPMRSAGRVQPAIGLTAR
ncbi:FtsX-like permease family protein [Humidisolicoccus flavus]|uniref:FtsX-like permease family protein n=1 Tax=Humidisolicoccus flavus TaxID=3111414 RepID=UPI003243D03E